MENLSNQEIELLRILQKSSKFEITELMDRLHMSRTSVYERIRRLEAEGYIKNYVALVDCQKVGLNFTVIVSVTLKSQSIEYVEEFSRQIASLDEVVEAFVTAGIFDYILKVVVKDPDTYNQFYAKKLSAIPQISKIQSSYVMTHIKESTELHF